MNNWFKRKILNKYEPKYIHSNMRVLLHAYTPIGGSAGYAATDIDTHLLGFGKTKDRAIIDLLYNYDEAIDKGRPRYTYPTSTMLEDWDRDRYQTWAGFTEPIWADGLTIKIL